MSEFAGDSGKDTVLSLRWTALDPTTELEAVLEINRASNWQEFEEGLEKFLAPAQNFVFASKDGTIAYKANGRIPIYENGDNALLPLRGWEEEDEWNGYIPFDELPTSINPEKGYIATANNKVVSDSYPYHISHNWAQPYRYQRIAEMIEEKETHTIESMKEMQLDVKNLQAEEFLPFMVTKLDEGSDKVEKAAMNLMEEWTYEDDRQLPQPLIYHTWNAKLQEMLYNDSIPKEVRDLFHGAGQTTDEILRAVMNGEKSIWMEEAGGIDHVLRESFSKTVDDLSEQYGDAPNNWRWGDGHAVEFTHPLSSISILERFFNPGDPVAVSGSRVTVRAAGYNDNGLVNHGASWRYVIDLAESSQADHVVGPGQSGHFRSEWYHDQFDDWVEGGYHTTDMNDFTGEDLRLTP
ncbi:penicillin acylase family protein [Halobacillus amylolyticus]|uniref:Penicillin acylase family protein n=1 Tax=Halobacillus amylolyticus TaxID=2932259 RepID=A0ABY4HHZ2_9BACI|nr:penicillin acylase family protein [Halobacillus amylolyticus]UOR13923.1 penicillin acylase family protein [Halobacillus amylolyticus]